MISDLHIPEFDFRKVIRWSLIAGAAWIAAVVVGWIFQPEKFYQAYLLAWMFWLGVTLGSIGIVMLHHLTGGNWGIMVRRLGEHAGMTLPLLYVLFIPILIGMHWLYPWDQSGALAGDATLRHDTPYLNVAFFCWRAAIYGAIWLALAWYLRSASLRYDRTLNESTAVHMHNVSAGGMVIYFVSMSLACVDWLMSLEPHWASTVFGFIIIVGQALGGLCVLVAFFTLMTRTRPFTARARPEYLNDLGNLMLTLVILWAYMSFAQLLVIWMGNKQ
ncbi:MAG TPA: hypothetical protein VMD30_09595, partial [Tepidisphaeraceae bacterium]|nr:hypothetical protein [Tepidisphaeraceae bacterium]